MKDWLLDKKFYEEEELETIRSGRNPPKYIFSRTNIKNDIHKISLKIMAKMSETYGELTFITGRRGLSNHYDSVTGEVNNLMTDIPGEVIAADPWINDSKGGKTLSKTLPENARTRALRHDYIHWSVQNKTGFGVRIKDGEPYRLPIPG